MRSSKKTERKCSDALDQSLYGIIRISSAIDTICEHVLPTLEKENYPIFREECVKHFKERIFRSFKMYSIKKGIPSPSQLENRKRLLKEIEMKLDDDANIIIPDDWENYFMYIDNFNSELKYLDVDGVTPKILSRDEERLLRESNPYDYSSLSEWLKHDTWKQNDGLLIMLGIEPTGAEVNWNGYENYLGIPIEKAQLINAELFKDTNDEYSFPHNLEAQEAIDEWGFSEESIESLAQRHEEIRLYSSELANVKTLWDASGYEEERYTIKHYIDWAQRKNIVIPWLDWAIDKELIAQPRTTKKEPTEERRERIRQRKEVLKAQGVNSFIKTIAAEESLSESRIKQILKSS